MHLHFHDMWRESRNLFVGIGNGFTRFKVKEHCRSFACANQRATRCIKHEMRKMENLAGNVHNGALHNKGRARSHGGKPVNPHLQYDRPATGFQHGIPVEADMMPKMRRPVGKTRDQKLLPHLPRFVALLWVNHALIDGDQSVCCRTVE